MAEENKSQLVASLTENDEKMNSETTALRENLIATAVRFLQNPKVIQSPLSQKKSFLEKKGLTPQEIDVAVARAGVTEVSTSSSGVIQTQNGTLDQSMVPGITTLSTWTKIKDYTSTVVIAGGLAYVIYKVYKQYIMPFWFGPSQEEQQLAAIQKSITELQSSVIETLKFIKDMQSSINMQQMKIDDLSSKSTTMQMSTNNEFEFVREVKDEIKSLKGLLLSRKQFPPAPPNQPVLPAWQLVTSKPDEIVTENVNNTQMVTAEVTNNGTVRETPEANNTESNVVTQEDSLNVSQTARDHVNEIVMESEAVSNGHITNGDIEKDVGATGVDITSIKSASTTFPSETQNQIDQTVQANQIDQTVQAS